MGKPEATALIEDILAPPQCATVLQNGKEILFQAFNWESWKKEWWRSLEEKVPELASAGFTALWLPPASSSLAPEGYLPTDLYCLNSAYGAEEELRKLLSTIKQNGLLSLADVVVNHRIGSTQGKGEYFNRYDGTSMPWDEHAITCDTFAGLGNSKTGCVFHGAPNIDHTQDFVRRDIVKWLKWLREDVGFSGFRFDFAKGYHPRFVKEYIQLTNPDFAVGEYWSDCQYGADFVFEYNQDNHRQKTVDWIDGAGGLAAAFDFTTKAILQVAVVNNEWWRMRDSKCRPSGVLGYWPSRAVTFIDNHDTGSTQRHWPFPSEHILKGYAYILTHPGQPTVFYDHFFEWGNVVHDVIMNLIAIRKKHGIHSRSSITITEASDIYVATIGESVCVKLGDRDWCPDPSKWKVITSGSGYDVWESIRSLY